jgi:hypothetical protein
MALTPNQKLAIGAVVGVGVLGAIMLASGKAQAATNPPANLDPNSTEGQAAIALAAQIQNDGGYRGDTQASLVTAFENAVGLAADGYPGTLVMTRLRQDLTAMGTDGTGGQTYVAEYPLVSSIATYPWLASAGWTSGNVPSQFVNNAAAWTGGSAVGT